MRNEGIAGARSSLRVSTEIVLDEGVGGVKRGTTPLGAILKGIVAGTIGTLIFDLVWYGRYKKGGGEQSFVDWDLSAGVESFDQVGAPGQVGKRLYEGALQRELKAEKARATNNIVHWGFGILNGAAYGVLAGSMRNPSVALGPPFGAAVWAAGYAMLTPMGLYKWPWEYDAQTIWKDLSAHLVYGAATAVAFRALAGRKDHDRG